MTDNTPVAPWYRQPWFWFLTIFPLASITFGLTMLVVSVNLDTAMVTDDYSKEGRGINMAIARDQKASEMKVSGKLQLANRKATLLLDTKDGPADFQYLILNLYHPTLEDKDRVIQFNRLADGEYSGQILEDLDGRWYFDLQGPDNDWRVKGEFWLPAEHPITIQAKANVQE
ncbi:FixH [Marinobacter litoralis]|uniref:FixH n=1 Tax=Marinobacter litoralis TaxID=187981 RepID=A0A3M2RKY1_9GAMM|nr:FixH family protein [Marinobacter litoralis]RMJ06010.1 FixH [Marinobacter litoralis]